MGKKMSELEKRVEESGIVKYSILQDYTKQKRVTVCLIKLGDEIGKGISICALSEENEKGFIKREGREKAYHNALRALKKKTHTKPINRKEAKDALALLDIEGKPCQTWLRILETNLFKSLYTQSAINAILSIPERKMLGLGIM